jgi:hypothetical protein
LIVAIAAFESYITIRPDTADAHTCFYLRIEVSLLQAALNHPISNGCLHNAKNLNAENNPNELCQMLVSLSWASCLFPPDPSYG